MGDMVPLVIKIGWNLIIQDLVFDEKDSILDLTGS